MQSELYNSIIEKGLKKGVETTLQQMRETAAQIWRQRFGEDKEAEGRIGRVQTPAQMQEVLLRLATASSVTEALAALPAP